MHQFKTTKSVTNTDHSHKAGVKKLIIKLVDHIMSGKKPLTLVAVSLLTNGKHEGATAPSVVNINVLFHLFQMLEFHLVINNTLTNLYSIITAHA